MKKISLLILLNLLSGVFYASNGFDVIKSKQEMALLLDAMVRGVDLDLPSRSYVDFSNPTVTYSKVSPITFDRNGSFNSEDCIPCPVIHSKPVPHKNFDGFLSKYYSCFRTRVHVVGIYKL